MNVIYINTHDSGRMLSPYGYDIPTENLKKLAEDSVVFKMLFVQDQLVLQAELLF